MKLFCALFCGLSVCALAQVPAGSVTVPVEVIPSLGRLPKETVLVQVNDIKITAGDLDRILLAYPENTRVFILGPGRQQFFDQLVRIFVLREEGKRRKLDDDPTYKLQAMYSLAGILSTVTAEEMKKSIVIDDDMLRKYLADHELEYAKLKARHILVRTKGAQIPVRPGQSELSDEEALAKAKTMLAKIKAGADFADIAREESDDPGSGAKGGDLAVFGHGQPMPSFEEAAYKLKPGEISEPVKSAAGYHIIQVQERQVKPFEELKPELEPKLRAELAKKQVDELVNKAKVILAPEILPSSKTAK